MRVLQRTDQVDSDHEVVDLTAHETPASTAGRLAPVEEGALDRGDRWGTVLAFAIAGALAIAAILGMWTAAPSPGL